MEVSDGFLTEFYGDRTGMNMLHEMLNEIIDWYAEKYADRLRVEKSEILDAVQARYRVGEVDEVVTIVDRVQSVDGNGNRIFIDRDIVGGALKEDHPGRAFTSYLRNKVRETARSLHRRVERTRRVSLNAATEPIEVPETLDEDLEWLRREVERLPLRIREAMTLYYRVGGNPSDGGAQARVAKRMGISRDKLQGLLKTGLDALRERARDLEGREEMLTC